jgi:beta-ribofuranosylaminobenzene 5'-phosphate synthase
MAERAVRVTAGSRLHFGMLSFGQPGRRQFGGAGAMISVPALRLSIGESDRFQATGPLADRVEQFVGQLARRAAWWRDEPRFRIDVEEAPPQHAGLGSGTQLGMALARGLAAWFRAAPQAAAELAAAVGRGKRSAVGVHGACLGGLIVESGKLGHEEVSPLVSRTALPDEWRFVLLMPAAATGLSGDTEQRAFDRLPPVPPETTAALCRELVSELIPAAERGDFDRFGEALYRYGQLAGQCFAAQQGGIYASPTIERLVARCRHLGVQGAGQSSWGPTVFALCRQQVDAEQLVASLTDAGELNQTEVLIAAPDNRGIRVDSVDGPPIAPRRPA